MKNNNPRKKRIISDKELDIPDNTFQNLNSSLNGNHDDKNNLQNLNISEIANGAIELKNIKVNNNDSLSYNTNNNSLIENNNLNNDYLSTNVKYNNIENISNNNNFIDNTLNNNDNLSTNINYNNIENISNNNNNFNININNSQFYYETNPFKPQIIYFNSYKDPETQKLINDRKKWKGSNYFPMKGRFLEGPCSFRPTLMTFCSISVPVFLFIFFNFEFIKKELTIIIPIIIILLYLSIIIFILIATFIDPGIIRRYPLEKDGMKIFKEKKIFQLGNIFSYKYCKTCNIIRPNRSTHCFDCNNCVERLDHHCPWIGNCAGKRNYKYFFIFLLLLNILTILLIILCIFHIVKKIKDQIKENDNLSLENKIINIAAYSMCNIIISLYIIIYCALSMTFTTSLLIFHIRLIYSNTLTKESLKHFWENVRKNPFTRKNIKTNFKEALNPKIKKYSLLDILKGVKEPPDYIETENNKNINDMNNNNSGKKIILEQNNILHNVEINNENSESDSRTGQDEETPIKIKNLRLSYQPSNFINNLSYMKKKINVFKSVNIVENDKNTNSKNSNDSNDYNLEKDSKSNGMHEKTYFSTSIKKNYNDNIETFDNRRYSNIIGKKNLSKSFGNNEND